MSARFWHRWMLAVTAGETIGFAVPALTGGMLALLSAPVLVVYPSMIVAGACEGVPLGLGQSIGFGTSVVPRSAWIRATAAGAAVAWSIGMLPSTIGGVDFGSPIALPLVMIGSIALLVSIPTLQWAVLRRPGHPVSSWIPVNAVDAGTISVYRRTYAGHRRLAHGTFGATHIRVPEHSDPRRGEPTVTVPLRCQPRPRFQA